MRTLNRNLFVSYLQTVVNIVTPIVVTPIVFRALGNTSYGLWALMMSIVGYFGLTNLGFTNTFLKDVAKYPEKINTLLTTTLVALGLFLLISVGPFIVISTNLDRFFGVPAEVTISGSRAFLLIYLSFILNFYAGPFGSVLFAKGRLYVRDSLRILHRLGSGVATAVVALRGGGLVQLALVYLVSAGAYLCLVALAARAAASFRLRVIHFDPGLLKSMFGPSIHYFIISVAVMVAFHTDNIVISAVFGVAAVANYSLTYKLTDILRQLVGKVVDVLFPGISALDAGREYGKLKTLHNKTMAITLVMGSLALAGTLILGPTVFRWWLGPEFVVNRALLAVFAVIMLVQSLVRVSGTFVAAMGRHRVMSYVSLAEAGLNIAISLILAQFLGVLGVALGTLFSTLLTSGWYNTSFFYRTIRIGVPSSPAEAHARS
jgi:O-antigen/teichoic acid export membrane protein